MDAADIDRWLALADALVKAEAALVKAFMAASVAGVRKAELVKLRSARGYVCDVAEGVASDVALARMQSGKTL